MWLLVAPNTEAELAIGTCALMLPQTDNHGGSALFIGAILHIRHVIQASVHLQPLKPVKHLSLDSYLLNHIQVDLLAAIRTRAFQILNSTGLDVHLREGI